MNAIVATSEHVMTTRYPNLSAAHYMQVRFGSSVVNQEEPPRPPLARPGGDVMNTYTIDLPAVVRVLFHAFMVRELTIKPKFGQLLLHYQDQPAKGRESEYRRCRRQRQIA